MRTHRLNGASTNNSDCIQPKKLSYDGHEHTGQGGRLRNSFAAEIGQDPELDEFVGSQMQDPEAWILDPDRTGPDRFVRTAFFRRTKLVGCIRDPGPRTLEGTNSCWGLKGSVFYPWLSIIEKQRGGRGRGACTHGCSDAVDCQARPSN